MTKWYVKELSQVTGVSVQALHHYDRIGLLKPSLRLPNGYRLYSEADLLRLQQIIALKYFGFELSQINTLLHEPVTAKQHFTAQLTALEKQAKQLVAACEALKAGVAVINDDKSIPWETIVKLIEVYQMSTQLEHTWVREIFTPDELKEYAEFELDWKRRTTPEQREEIEQSWASLVQDLTQYLDQDPQSSIGIELGQRCMIWVNQVYGKKYAHLRTKKFEQGFGEGKGLDEVGLTPQMVVWLDQAMSAYCRDRIQGLLAKIGKLPDDQIKGLWEAFAEEMYGDDRQRQQALYELVMSHEETKLAEKDWLRQHMISDS